MIAPDQLIDRKTPLTPLQDQLANGRLLTLVGPPGAGKTSLALALGRAAHFPDGVYYVPLAGLESAKFGDSFHPLAAAIANALDFVFYGQRGSGQQLLAYLRAKSCLLILDDFDHLAADGRDYLTALLQETVGVKLLVVGRERLGWDGEQIYAVPGLDAPGPDATDWLDYPAVQLYRQIAPQAERADLIRFSQQVGGNPLALQLAAASQTPLADALAALERAGERAGEPAGEPLDNLLDYLWARRSPEEQRALAQLALFRGGFTAAAAETVGVSPDMLAQFTAQRQLTAAKDGRYQWPNTLRQYALNQLAARDADAARDQHAHYYTKKLADLWSLMRGAGYGAAVSQIKQEIDDIRAAWRWAAQRGQFDWLAEMIPPLWLFYAESEWTSEGLDRFGWAADTVADRAETAAQQIVHNQLITHLAWFHHLKDENKVGAEKIKTAVEALRQLEAGWPLAMAQLTAGVIYYRLRRYNDASDALQTSANLFAQLGDTWGEAICLNRLGEAARRVGDYAEAKGLYAQSLAMFQEIEYPLGLAWVFSNLAVIAREEGDYDHALSLLAESLRLSQANRRYQAVCICLTISGQLKLLQGNYREAYPLCQEAYELATERGDELSAAFSARYLGHICLETAKYGKAERFYTASQAAFWRAGDISGVATSYAHLSEVARQQSNWETAEQLARQGIKQTRADLDNLFTDFLELLVALARLYADTHRMREAARLLAFVREQGMARQVVLEKMSHCEQLTSAVLTVADRAAAAWGREQTAASMLEWLDRNNNLLANC